MKKLRVRKVQLKLSPVEVAMKLTHADSLVFLDSSGNLPQVDKSALSIIAAFPVKTIEGRTADFSGARITLECYEAEYDSDVPNQIPAGGLFGGIKYDGSYSFGLYEDCLIFDHGTESWYEVGDLQGRFVESNEPCNEIKFGEFEPLITPFCYMEMVNQAKDYISAGDIYQVNLSQKFTSKVKSGDFFGLYSSLRDSTPAPMSAYFKLPNGQEILSSSPETFLNITGDVVETRPIKGTRPRFDDKEEDAASARELVESAKERAELVMITDLERNDLGQVCEFGSVKVEEMLKLETFEHVYHLVSTVTGKIKNDLDHFDVINSCFPGGSITGAPKVRAMEIIDELELEPRGYYTGALGYIGVGGASQFSITIRTLVREGDEIHYHVGAGIVADSEALAEYEETLHKAKGMLKACGINN